MTSSSSLPELSLDPYKADTLPRQLPSFLDSASSLLASFPSTFHEGRTYTFGDHSPPVKTWSRKESSEDGLVGSVATWHARHSTHPASEYDDFKRGLIQDHYENERAFIPTLDDVDLMPSPFLDPLQPDALAHVGAYRLRYTLPIVAKRTFVVLLLSQETVPGREFLNVTIPLEHDDVPEGQGDEKGRVRGRYCSVERVKILDNGELDWLMLVASSPGGSIPSFLANLSIPKEIAKDVPAFLGWLRDHPAA